MDSLEDSHAKITAQLRQERDSAETRSLKRGEKIRDGAAEELLDMRDELEHYGIAESRITIPKKQRYDGLLVAINTERTLTTAHVVPREPEKMFDTVHILHVTDAGIVGYEQQAIDDEGRVPPDMHIQRADHEAIADYDQALDELQFMSRSLRKLLITRRSENR